MTSAGPVRRLRRAGLDALLALLRWRGYRVLGPVVRSGGVVFDEVQRTADPPAPNALDRVIRAELGRYTFGLSPSALSLAYLDWVLHLALAPGTCGEGHRSVPRWLVVAGLAGVAGDEVWRTAAGPRSRSTGAGLPGDR